MTCNRITFTLNNSKCVEMRGCVLIGYRNGQEVGKDGVRPVGKTDGIVFSVSANNMTHWRFIGAVDYSDEPENSDVVLIDTGIKTLTKCDYTITCNPKPNEDKPDFATE